MVSIPSYNTHIATYDPIATITLTSAQSSVTFSNITQEYKDLVIYANIGTTSGTQNIQLQVNSDTGSNYSYTFLAGNGSAAYSGRYSSQTQIIVDNYSYPTSSIESTYSYNLLSYSNTSVYKTILGLSGTASRAVNRTVGLWRSTNAITSVKLYPSGSETFKSGCKFSLFGIRGEL